MARSGRGVSKQRSTTAPAQHVMPEQQQAPVPPADGSGSACHKSRPQNQALQGRRSLARPAQTCAAECAPAATLQQRREHRTLAEWYKSLPTEIPAPCAKCADSGLKNAFPDSMTGCRKRDKDLHSAQARLACSMHKYSSLQGSWRQERSGPAQGTLRHLDELWGASNHCTPGCAVRRLSISKPGAFRAGHWRSCWLLVRSFCTRRQSARCLDRTLSLWTKLAHLQCDENGFARLGAHCVAGLGHDGLGGGLQPEHIVAAVQVEHPDLQDSPFVSFVLLLYDGVLWLAANTNLGLQLEGGGGGWGRGRGGV